MLKIVSKIAPVQEELDRYKDLFSKPQFYHFSNYVTGLIVENHSWTINNMNKLFFESKDQSSANRFMTKSPWDVDKITTKRMKVIDQEPKTKTKGEGVIILDDTVNPKTGKKMEGVGWHHYNNPTDKNKKFTFGHSVVSTHYADNDKEYPISPEVYVKKESAGDEFKTKIELGIKLITDAVKKYRVRGKTVVMDAWYLCKKLVEKVREFNLDWVSCAKVNRKVKYNGEWISISKLIKSATLDKEITIGEDKYVCKSFTLLLSRIGMVKLVLSRKKDPKTDEEKKIFALVANRLDWDEFTILSKYLMRHHIEGFYRDSKQVLGLGKYMMRDLAGVVRHLHLGFLAYTILETLTLKGNSFFGWLKDKVLSIGERCKIIGGLAVRGFVKWCNCQFRRRVPLYKVFEELAI